MQYLYKEIMLETFQRHSAQALKTQRGRKGANQDASIFINSFNVAAGLQI